MKLDRRTFIELGVGFSVGAGTGFMLTPVNWKLMDDVAIWTQNWPWVPVPERGKVTHVNSVCTLCPGGCGITVRKVEDRATKIEGRKGYPVNKGGICILGAAGLQLLYGPWRVPSPLRRVGKRGSGHFERISWDEAINAVVQKLRGLRQNNQSHTLACISGSDRGTMSQLFDRFLKAYGSPNFIRTASAEDTYELALGVMQGTTASVAYDLERANFILSFGSGLIEGWGSPVRVIKAHSMWRSGNSKERATVVQIEPRLSNTAAKADNWYPVNPGTEAALALGLAHVIIKESLYDLDFIRNHTFGFEDWGDFTGKTYMGFKHLVLTEYTPEAVARITGLSAKKIIELARAFAKAERPLAVWGRGKGTISGSLYECMAVHALNALVGNINKPGGVSARPQVATQAWPDVDQDTTAWTGCRMPRLDGAGTSRYPLTKYLPERLFQIINAQKAGTIQALLVHEADPYYTTLDSAAVAKAFDRIPFVVSFSTYMDETAYHADLILPNHHYLERWEDVPTPVGLQKPILGLLKPAVSPQFDTRHTGDVLMAIAKGLGGTVANAFPWEDYETLLKETMGDKWDTLEETGYVEEADYEPPARESGFGTPSGKFEFYVTAFDQAGMKMSKDVDYLPHYEPVEPEGSAVTYPLILIPLELMRLADGAVGNPPFCTKTLEETELKGNDLFVEINPKTAADFRLSEGQHAILETPKGKAKVLVHLFEGIMPGVIAIPKGLGHTAYDDYLAGKGVNANSLMGVVEDPISGLSATWGIRAKLTSV
ncbi:MAG: molybdopterin-dependent oxidoreductase [Deltaproteobacteria bacterium]|nr:molybdopterin-dependent oxidoreductase [Deltaproteobacteria bacterium]MBW2019792.1 molybdopterin-dependent oxidoreductase [Deltaproteobacteria bacterium]MBW2074597.1 molybdopterin-dependent oxidoreductase [Deltaproteobacteria bacterium]